MTSLVQIAGLAIVDAINPCALMVMAIVLMSLLMNNPEKRRMVLYGGFSFTAAVFILYFIYGLGLTSVFYAVSPFVPIFNNAIAIFSIILGILNVKDYLMYQPGGFATEMPLSIRPKMKLWIKRIESPKGAFIVGLLVTFFLLPCTIGPYIVASGVLSDLSIIQRVPWLLFYNLVFVLPMLAVTFAIYLGFTTVDKVSGWKESNVRYLHLIEGLILIVLGILMITKVLA
jgi:cytochrome c biogenesis protein CcdA